MKIGLVGYQGCGKSTLFEFLTGVRPDPAQAHVGQSAMAHVPEARVEPLCAVYHPKKVTLAALELERNFVPPVRRGDDAMLFVSSDQEKSGKRLEARLSPRTWRLISLYCRKYRPFLPVDLPDRLRAV